MRLDDEAPAAAARRTGARLRLLPKTGIVLLTVFACEAPLGVTPSPWGLVAYCPGGNNTLASDGDKVFIKGEYDYNGDHYEAIYTYANGGFKLEYVMPYGAYFYEGGGNYLDAGFGYCWAAGETFGPELTNFGASIRNPFIVKYDGSTWAEVPVPPELGFESFSSVTAAGPNKCWSIGQYREKDESALILYDGGQWHVFEGLVGNTYYARDTGILYVVDWGDAENEVVAITTDDGATWTKEEIKADAAGYELGGSPAGCALGDRLFLTYELSGSREFAGSRAFGIVERTGTPGEGSYALTFITVKDPAADYLDNIALSTFSSGIAVGKSISVSYDGKRWQKEDIPPSSYWFNDVVAGSTGGFWAIARDERNKEGNALFYHP